MSEASATAGDMHVQRAFEAITPEIRRKSPGDAGLCAKALSRMTQVLEREIAGGVMPGAVAMVGRRGTVGYCEALGVQSPVTGVPMRADSLFRIYSMTKPLTSVGLMMLAEEGRLRIDQPLSAFIPDFSSVAVARFTDGALQLDKPRREITVQDLLRHTSGLSHEAMPTPLQARYAEVGLARRDRTNEEHARLVASLPLLCHPGEQWNYSRSVEVLGRVIEVVSGQSLGEFLRERLFAPLGMDDTGFHAPPSASGRLAEPHATDPLTGRPTALFDMLERPIFEAGGGGLVSTAPDYARFAQMLLEGGTLEGRRYLGSRTLRFMRVNHLPATLPPAPDPLPPGYGFGLGFAVRLEAGLAPFAGSVGSYFWNGVAGTQFWADPAERLWAILMVQAPHQREHLRVLFRTLVYAALDD